MSRPYVVAWTGASGVIYGVRTVQVLAGMGHEVALIISDAGRLVLREELGLHLPTSPTPLMLRDLFACEALKPFDFEASSFLSRIQLFSPKDFTAPVASGSFPTQGMVIVPCSMGTLGAVAGGISQNLIHRAADCTLKEGRRLVIVPRETPLHAIHLENMLKLAKMGVRVVPAMPGFYSGAVSLREMIDFVVGKILDQLEIPHALYPRWVGSAAKESHDRN